MYRAFGSIATAAIAASALLACSDPIPPPDQSLLFMAYTNGNNCEAAGLPPLLHPPSITEWGFGQGETSEQALVEADRAVDGEGGYRVSCRVRSDGDGRFSVTGNLSAPRMDFDVSGTVAAGMGQTMRIANAAARRPELGGSTDRVSDPACALDVKFVDAGAIHASFQCPNMTGNQVLCASRGEFVFENCSK